MKNLVKYIPLFRVLSTLKPAQRAEIYAHLDEDTINAVCECIHNITRTDIGLTKRKCAYLKKHLKERKSKLAFLSNKRNNVGRKRTILKQEGGALGLILSAAIPLLTSLLLGK